MNENAPSPHQEATAAANQIDLSAVTAPPSSLFNEKTSVNSATPFLNEETKNRPSSEVFAYQVFDPKMDPMTARDIADRFTEVGWKKRGMSHGSVRTRIHKIILAADDAIRRRSICSGIAFTENVTGEDPLRAFHIRLDAAVRELCHEMEFETLAPNPELLVGAIKAFVNKALAPQLRSMTLSAHREDPEALLACGCFLDYVCGAPSAAAFARIADEQRVRPYELFLFAHQIHFEKDKLTSELSQISIPLTPQYTSSLSILDTHDGIDNAISEWGRKYSRFPEDFLAEISESICRLASER